MFVPRATSSCADARAHLQVGALDGLSPGLSAASSADSLRSLLRGRRGRSTTDDEGSKASRESSSENLSVHSASCRSDPGGLSSSVTSRASRTRHGGFNSTSQITRVQFQVTVETHFGDHVRVVGSCPELGCWQPDKSQLLTTDPSMYPTWTGSLEMSSSEPFEYKYIIQRAPAVSSSPSPAASLEWEGKIGNRAAIPEGVFVVLEDGHFNMERATVFDRSHRKVDVTGQGSCSGFIDHAAGGRAGLASEQASKQSLFIISFKLPLKTSRLPSGGYRFEWHPGKHSTTSSRHAGYVVEKVHVYIRVNIHSCIHACVRVCIHPYMHACTCEFRGVDELRRLCNRMCACIHVHTHMYISTHIHACMHACMHAYMHACIHA